MGEMAISRKTGVKPHGRLREASLQHYRKTGLCARRLRLIGERVSASLGSGGLISGTRSGLKLVSWGIFLSLPLLGLLWQPILPEAEIAPKVPSHHLVPALSPAVESLPPVVVSRAARVKKKGVAVGPKATSSSKPNGANVQMQVSEKEPKPNEGTLAIQLQLYKSGLAFFEEEEWEEATRAFHSIIINYPDSPLKSESLYRVVLGLSFQGKCNEALTYFKEAEETSSIPEVHRLRFVLSRCNSQKALSSP